MKFGRFLVNGALAVFTVAVFAYGLLAAQLFLIGENPLDFHVDPLLVRSVDPGNQYLVAPAALALATPSAESPRFAASPRELMGAIDRIALKRPRTKLAAGAPSELWATYVERTKYMRFPDYISVVAVGLPDGESTIAIFSQSVYGSSDLGVNEARVEAWIRELEKAVPQAQ